MEENGMRTQMKKNEEAPAPERRPRRSGGKRLASGGDSGERAPSRQRKPGRRESKRPKGTGWRWRKLSKKERLVLLIPAAAAAVAVLIVFLLNRDAMRLTLEGSPIQYYGGGGFPIAEGTVLRRTAEDVTLLNSQGSERELTSLPIYYQDRQIVTLPQTMAYYAPRSGTMGGLSYFTEIRFQTNGSLQAERDGKSANMEKGFLFDGKDFYLFLEPVELTFNGYQMELPAMSYVEAIYNGDIMVFNYETKEFFMEAPKTTVLASAGGGDYEVSLLGDSLTTRDGSKTLLFTRPEIMQPVN